MATTLREELLKQQRDKAIKKDFEKQQNQFEF